MAEFQRRGLKEIPATGPLPVSVPGAVVVIAALAGGALGGLLGALVAIPVAASLLIIYRQVIIPRQNER